MPEFSGTTRLVATLLLLVLSLAAWKWLLQSPSGGATANGAAGGASGAAAKAPRKPKKKSKKRATAKKAAASARDEADSSEQMSATTAVATEEEDGGNGSDDSDDGLSAVQVLAKRKFQVKAIGAVPTTKKNDTARGAGVTAPKYELNQRVLARFEGGREWFPATIMEIRRGNEYHVKYDDGEIEYHVPHALIKPRDAEPSPTSPRTASSTTATMESTVASHAGDQASAAPHASESDDDGDGTSDEDEDDGWEMVGGATSGKTKKSKNAASASTAPVVGEGGLTKRQRENRRKKERQKEIKELARAQAQENGLHAKWGGTYSKMKYVPPPKQA
uniref:Tudor domain-containing protein n=1 Tax=Globisporangium ultimum (strain ATCC 200006 / CBS 805.95 / DAOM BR144) TaxID=431595 RepID=K3WDV7_GLOUD